MLAMPALCLQALSAYQQALQCEPQNKEVQTKVRSLKQQLAKDKKHSKRQSTPQPGPMPARQQQPAAAFGAQGAMADTCAAQVSVRPKHSVLCYRHAGPACVAQGKADSYR